MNAQQARELAINVSEGKNKAQYVKIKQSIDIAAKQGKREIHLYEFILAGVAMRLKIEGFNLVNTSYRNEETSTISW